MTESRTTSLLSSDKRRQQAGMSLIEVLVAILIFSFGLIGLMGLQARALQFSTSAEDTSRASLLANEMASTMVMKGTVSTTTLATDITNWNKRINPSAADMTANGINITGLPNGVGTVTADPAHANAATILITWLPTSAASGAASSQYFTYVILP